MKISSRHHLRSDEVTAITDMLEQTLGVEVEATSFELVELADTDYDVVLIDGDPLVWYPGGEPFLTVNGANEFEPTRRLVEVDTGAISFVSDGADVMRPGINTADESITAGDLVIVVEEAHGKALAIGRAETDGDDMVGENGKVVSSLHHVGDELYTFSV